MEQFRQAMKALRIGAAADAAAVEGLFALLDRDGTGTIDFRELHQLVSYRHHSLHHASLPP